MDSRIREALDAKAFDTIIRCRPARVIMYDDAIALLTARPKPCEGARKSFEAWASGKGYSIEGSPIYADWDTRRNWDGWEAASQVADKRAEDHKDFDGLIREVGIRGDEVVKLLGQVEMLRAQVETLRRALEQSTDQLYAMNTSPVHAGSWVEPRSNTTTKRIALNREALAATEPKP